MSFLRRILDQITLNILATRIIGAAGGIGLLVWAFFLQWWGPTLVLVGLAIPIMVLIGANQVQAFFERRPRRLSSDELAKQLTDWLIEHGYTVKRQQDPDTDFVLITSFEPQNVPKDPLAIVITRFSDDKPPILLSASMGFGDADKENWAALPPRERDPCILEAQMDMMRFGFSFKGLGSELEPVTIFKSLPASTFFGRRVVTEKDFIEEVQLIRRASNIIRLSISKALRS